MSKSKAVGTTGENHVLDLLNGGAVQLGVTWRWRRTGDGRPGSDVEAFRPSVSLWEWDTLTWSDPVKRAGASVWDPHVEIRRRDRWEPAKWIRDQIAKFGPSDWFVWLRPRDRRRKDAVGGLIVPESIAVTLLNTEAAKRVHS